MGDGRGHPRVRQRQHGRAARRRAACLRHGRRRPHLRGVSGRRARGRRRGRGDPRAGRDRLPRAVRGDGQHPPHAVRGRACRRSSRRRAGMPWSASPRSCSITTVPSSGFWRPPTQSLPAGELDALRAWLPQGRVDQKRDDALAMLAAMRALLASGPEPMRVDYTLEWTEVWDDATAAAAASPVVGPRRVARVGCRSSACSRSCASRPIPTPPCATGRCCGSWQAREAERRRHTADTGARRERARSPARPPRPVYPRRPRPLARGERDRGQAAGTAARGRSAARVRSTPWRRPPCAMRCSTSCACATSSPASPRAPATSRLRSRRMGWTIRLGCRTCAPPPGLRAWYFEQRLGRPLPDDIDAAARELGFADRADFDRALRREWLYCNRGDAGEYGSMHRTWPLAPRQSFEEAVDLITGAFRR